jgi:hypothetical protein
MTTAKEFLDRVHEIATVVGWQAGVGGVETAGQIISCLYANPEAIDRFMTEGAELILDGTISAENGSLTYHASNGKVVSPSELRARKGLQQ